MCFRIQSEFDWHVKRPITFCVFTCHLGAVWMFHIFLSIHIWNQKTHYNQFLQKYQKILFIPTFQSHDLHHAFITGNYIISRRLEMQLLFIVEIHVCSFVAGADNHCSAITNSSIWYCWIWAHGQTHPIQRRVVLLQGHRGKQTETPHPVHPRAKAPTFPQVKEDYYTINKTDHVIGYYIY